MWKEIKKGVYGYFPDEPLEIFDLGAANERIKEIDSDIEQLNKEKVKESDYDKHPINIRDIIINKNNEIDEQIKVLEMEREGLKARIKEIVS